MKCLFAGSGFWNGLWAAIASTLMVAGCKEVIEFESVRTGAPIEIDGRRDGWPAEALRAFAEQQVTVGVANDSASLFLLVEFDDLRMARAVSVTGLRLEFHDPTEKSSLFILRYHDGPPLGSAHLTPIDGTGSRGGPPPGIDNVPPGFDMAGVNDRRPVRPFTCEIRGRIIEKEIPVGGAEGPRVAFNADRDRFCYEFSIPLERGAVRYYGLGVEPGDRVEITAIWGDRSDMNRDKKRLGGLVGGFSGGMPTGGEPPGGVPGGGPPGGFGGGGEIQKKQVRLSIGLAAAR